MSAMRMMGTTVRAVASLGVGFATLVVAWHLHSWNHNKLAMACGVVTGLAFGSAFAVLADRASDARKRSGVAVGGIGLAGLVAFALYSHSLNHNKIAIAISTAAGFLAARALRRPIPAPTSWAGQPDWSTYVKLAPRQHTDTTWCELTPWSRAATAPSPTSSSDLLDPRRAVVGYLDRPGLDDCVREWLETDQPCAVIQIAGVAGSGKTRMAWQLVDTIMTSEPAGIEWDVLLALRPVPRHPGATEKRYGLCSNTLVIADDAELWAPGAISALIEALVEAVPENGRLRVVVLGRDPKGLGDDDDIWLRLQREPVLQLGLLYDDEAKELYERAARRFASLFAWQSEPDLQVPQGMLQRSPTPLTITAAAIVEARAAGSQGKPDIEDVARLLLDQERRRRYRRLPADLLAEDASGGDFSDLLFLACLVGPTSRHRARAWTAAAHLATDMETQTRLLDAHAQLYPGGALEPLHPDWLAYWYVGAALAAAAGSTCSRVSAIKSAEETTPPWNGPTITDLFDMAQPSEIRRALEVLSGAGESHDAACDAFVALIAARPGLAVYATPSVVRSVTVWCEDNATRMAFLFALPPGRADLVAPASELASTILADRPSARDDHREERVRRAMVTLIGRRPRATAGLDAGPAQPYRPGVVAAVARWCDYPTTANVLAAVPAGVPELMEPALDLARRVFAAVPNDAKMQAKAKSALIARLEELAAWTMKRARTAATTGDLDAEIEARRRAVQLHGELAGADSSHLPAYATALMDLAAALVRKNDPANALEHHERAIGLWTKLAAQNPTHRLGQARAASGLGATLASLRRPTDALPYQKAAVELWAEFADDNPAAHRPDYARALTDVGATLVVLDRFREALPHQVEALKLWEDLAGKDPAHRLSFAHALSNLGTTLGALDRAFDASAYEEQAVDLWADLAAEDPVHRPNHARALTNLAITMGILNRGDHTLPRARREKTATVPRGRRDSTAKGPQHKAPAGAGAARPGA